MEGGREGCRKDLTDYVTDEEIMFAEERLKLHNENPTEGMSVEEFKKRFSCNTFL